MAKAKGLGRVKQLVEKVRKTHPQMAYLLDDDEVGPLLLRLVDGQFDQAVFQSKLMKTRWYRKQADSKKKWDALVSIKPGEAKRRRRQATANIKNIINQLGINLKAKKAYKGKKGAKNIGANAMLRIADMSLRNGWNQDELTDYLLSQAEWKDEGQNPGAGLGASMRELRAMAQSYLVNPTEKQLFNWSKRVLSGEATPESMSADLATRARTRFGDNETIAGIIDRGGSPDDYFQPIRQAMANELEIDESAIDFVGDPKWAQVVNHAGDDGKLRPMTATEATRHARSQDEWRDTQGYREQKADLNQTLATIFGKRR